ncbi:hypothetical protein TNCV_4752551 [Trichonephila clavipes]|nr:hypothetical protein TNCV_4752551 [Trichonephila clavipes]
MIDQFRNEKVSNHASIPITIDCNVVAFIVFEEGFHQPIKRTKQSVFLDLRRNILPPSIISSTVIVFFISAEKQIRKEEHVVARPYIATIGHDEIDIETSTEQSAEA